MNSTPSRSVDVLIVGAGPAGSVLGGLLADGGADVLVVDRATFPRRKPCGESINPAGVHALRRLGLFDAVIRTEPARILGWEVRNEDGVGGCAWFEADRSTDTSAPFGLGISRFEFDPALADWAVRAGAAVTFGTRVRGIGPCVDGRRTVQLTRSDGETRTLAARAVIGADGLRSMVARTIGAIQRRPRLRKLSLTAELEGHGLPRDRGQIRISDRGTVGIAPIGSSGDRWNATVVVDSASHGRGVAADPAGFFRSRLDRIGPRMHVRRLRHGPIASGPFDWPTRTVVADGVLLVGDAAGYYDPLTGQGIARALRSAELAAPILLEALRTGRASAARLRPYENDLRRTFRPSRVFQHGVEAVVSHRRMRRWVFGRIARSREVGSALIRVIGDLDSPLSILRPRTVGRILLPGRDSDPDSLAGWTPYENRR